MLMVAAWVKTFDFSNSFSSGIKGARDEGNFFFIPNFL